MLTVAVTEAIEIVRLDFVPKVARLKLLRSIGYSCPAATLITRNVVQLDALDAVQKVTEAAGWFALNG